MSRQYRISGLAKVAIAMNLLGSSRTRLNSGRAQVLDHVLMGYVPIVVELTLAEVFIAPSSRMDGTLMAHLLEKTCERLPECSLQGINA